MTQKHPHHDSKEDKTSMVEKEVRVRHKIYAHTTKNGRNYIM